MSAFNQRHYIRSPKSPQTPQTPYSTSSVGKGGFYFKTGNNGLNHKKPQNSPSYIRDYIPERTVDYPQEILSKCATFAKESFLKSIITDVLQDDKTPATRTCQLRNPSNILRIVSQKHANLDKRNTLVATYDNIERNCSYSLWKVQCGAGGFFYAVFYESAERKNSSVIKQKALDGFIKEKSLVKCARMYNRIQKKNIALRRELSNLRDQQNKLEKNGRSHKKVAQDLESQIHEILNKLGESTPQEHNLNVELGEKTKILVDYCVDHMTEMLAGARIFYQKPDDRENFNDAMAHLNNIIGKKTDSFSLTFHNRKKQFGETHYSDDEDEYSQESEEDLADEDDGTDDVIHDDHEEDDEDNKDDQNET